jgi:hypothetical protein
MSEPTPEWKVSKILEKRLFYGWSYRKIESVTDVSIATISLIVNRFWERVKETSLIEAAKEYHIYEEYKDAVELGKRLNKNLLTPESARVGLDLMEKMREMGVHTDEVEDLLTGARATASENVTPAEFGRAVMAVVQKMKETGKLPGEAAKDVVEVYEERGRLQEEIEKSKQNRREEYRAFETTKRQVGEYVKARDTLEGAGLHPGDLGKLSNLMSNYQAAAGMTQLLKLAEDTRDLPGEVKRLHGVKNTLEDEIEGLSGKRREQLDMNAKTNIEIERLKGTRDSLKEVVGLMSFEWEEELKKYRAAEEGVGRLREELRPFASYLMLFTEPMNLKVGPAREILNNIAKID